MKPFLKWAGGKYRIIDRIKAALPDGLRLIEPFCGSTAVFMNTSYAENIIADSNADLINVFTHVQSGGSGFINDCRQLFTPRNNKSESFYLLRQEFNTTDNLYRKAALFIYLNRHCFNGLCRYNSKGQFNVPFGRYTKPHFPEVEIMAFAEKSQTAQFRNSDFVSTMENARMGDVVYCDPPYVPLTSTSNFTSYTTAGFGMKDQQKLADMAQVLQNRGIPVIISNHDTDFTRTAYSSAQLDYFKVQRLISSNGSNRGKANELLAIFA